MSAARKQKQRIEVPEKRRRIACFNYQVFTLRPLDHLHAGSFMQSAEKSVEIGAQVDLVKNEKRILSESCGSGKLFRQWVERSKFDVLPALTTGLIMKTGQQLSQFIRRTDERVTMICEGNGNQTVARNPALYLAKHETVPERFPGPRGGQDDRPVAVCSP
jgi:hypothetical protein